MAAVRRGDLVGVGQCGAHRRRDRFLAHVEVEEARQLRLFGEPARALLEEPDADHASMHVQQHVRTSFHAGFLPGLSVVATKLLACDVPRTVPSTSSLSSPSSFTKTDLAEREQTGRKVRSHGRLRLVEIDDPAPRGIAETEPTRNARRDLDALGLDRRERGLGVEAREDHRRHTSDEQSRARNWNSPENLNTTSSSGGSN
jgi:hypothetical protein